MDKKNQFLDKYILEVNLYGTKFIDMKEFYAQFDEYQSYGNKQKQQIKLFLYSAYYVDKYRFESVKNWNKIKIINKNTNQDTYFDLKKYLTQTSNSTTKLKETDYSISIDANFKELSVCYSPKLNKINLHTIGEMLYNMYSILELILSDLGVEDKVLQKWSTIIDSSADDFSQKIDISSFYSDIKTGYTRVINVQYSNISSDEVNRVFKQYEEEVITVALYFRVLNSIKIKQDNQLEILNLHIWDILMNNAYAPYLSTSFPVELENKYIGQAFGIMGVEMYTTELETDMSIFKNY